MVFPEKNNYLQTLLEVEQSSSSSSSSLTSLCSTLNDVGRCDVSEVNSSNFFLSGRRVEFN